MKMDEFISDKVKKPFLDFADTTLGALAFGLLIVCFIILLNYALLWIANNF